MDPSADRRRDLLLTAVMVGIVLTPAWLLPSPVSEVWQLGTLLLAGPSLWLSWTHAPWHPTPSAELQRLVARLDLGPDDTFCDLGAGDGRVLLAVHAATGARCRGIEASPLAWLVARLRTAGRPRVSVTLGDLARADLSDVDVAYVWGTAYSVSTEAFARRMAEALRPGARLVSYHHPVPGLRRVAEDRGGERPLHVYVIDAPANDAMT